MNDIQGLYTFFYLAVGLLVLLITVGVGVWLYRDAERRGMSAVLWVIAWLVGGLVTLVIYLIVRSSRRPRSPSAYRS